MPDHPLHNRELTYKAKLLRKNMTKEERRLWFEFLKDYSEKVLAQKVIDPYIVDFYCPAAKLAIELDGDHHYSDLVVISDDYVRDKQLSKMGIVVVRISNYDIKNYFKGVCITLDSVIQRRLSTPF